MTTMLDKLADALDPLAATDVDRFTARARVIRVLEVLERLNARQIDDLCAADSAHYIIGDPDEVIRRLRNSIVEEYVSRGGE